MKIFLLLFIPALLVQSTFGQFNPANPPNDCGEAVPGCTTPSFPISPNVPGTNNFDFGTGTTSNPSSNPNPVPGNMGCLLTGETSSTFITISVVSSGTLAWSIQGPNGGCFDWIMWPYTNAALTCTQIATSTLAPVACNWNSPCQGFTGMAPIGGLPAGGTQGNFEQALNVTAGQQFLLCLSNFSGTSQNVNLNFFGTAGVACGVSAPDQTICAGSSAIVNIATPGFINPTFNWLTTNGVSNVTGGTNVVVSPTSTTTYSVQVIQMASPTTVGIIDTAVFTIFVENLPNPNAGLDDTVCLGEPIQLNGSISNLTNSKSWNYNASGVTPVPTVNFSPNFSLLNPVVTVNQPGMYDFILRETHPLCGLVRDTVRIYVKQMSLSANVVSPSCVGDSNGQIQLTGPDAMSYSFDQGQTFSPNSTNGNLAAGTYQVCVRDQNNCEACAPVTISDPDPVLIAVYGDTVICQNGEATLVATASGGSSFQYHWNHTSSQNDQQFVQPLLNEIYAVVAENDQGCFSDSAYLSVQVLPALSGTMVWSDSICPGTSSTLLAQPQGGGGGLYHFSWNNGIQGDGWEHSQVVQPISSTSYQVVVTDNCESTPLVLSADLWVAPLPVPLFEADTNSKCEPATFVLNILTSASDYVSSTWFVNGQPTYFNQSNVEMIGFREGTYDIELVLNNQFGCVDSLREEAFLTVHPLPEPEFRFSPTMPTIFNTSVKFEQINGTADWFEWDFGNIAPYTSTASNPTVDFPEGIADRYPVYLNVVSNFGCEAQSMQWVEIFPEVLIFAPNTFTPNGDMHNNVWKVVLEGIDVYDFELEIRNRWGEIIFFNQDPYMGWDGTVDGTVIESGFYPWRMKVKDRLSGQQYLFNGTVQLMR